MGATSPSLRPFLQRVTRYVPGASDPRENRLTEITAGVMEHVDGFALALALAIVEEGRDPSSPAKADEVLSTLQSLRVDPARYELRVDTQLPVAGKYIDLSLTFIPCDGRPSVTIWVEVKHGSPFSGEQQPENYESRLQVLRGQRAKALVVLAPRGANLGQTDESLLVATWQGAGRRVEAESLTRTAGTHERWLLEQYRDYLREGGLMDQGAITEGDQRSLQGYGAAMAGIARICEVADRELTKSWGTPRPNGPRKHVPGFWSHHRSFSSSATDAVVWAADGSVPDEEANGLSVRTGWEPVLFEWGLHATDGVDQLDQARGPYCFSAGLTFWGKGDPAFAEDAAERELRSEWFSRLEEAGFRLMRFGGLWRAREVVYLDELFSESSLEAQGELVAKRVVDAFECLSELSPAPEPGIFD